jgi:hypothetical protein
MGDGKIRNGRTDPKTAKAIARRKELRAQNAAEVAKISSHLLASLPRPPTIADELQAELVARTAVKIRRLAEVGRESIAERTLLAQLMRESGFGQVAAPSPALVQHGASVAAAYDEHNRQAGIAALHGYVDPAPDEETAADEVNNAG